MSKITDSDAVELLHRHGVNIITGEIFLTGVADYSSGSEGEEPGVEHIMATQFIKNLSLLQGATDAKGKFRPITIHMKTCGGDWQEGMAIYDAIKACPNPVTIISYTHARSMSSIILQAADTRLLMPHSYVMLHEGETSFSGTEKAARSQGAFFNDLHRQMIGVYSERMRKGSLCKGWSTSRIAKFIQQKFDQHEDWYMWAAEAIQYGLADAIIKKGGK